MSILDKYFIYTAKKENQELRSLYHNGDADFIDDAQKPHFIISMWALNQEYYLCRNRDNDNYTLFAERDLGRDGYTFRKPIGYGLISDDIKNIIEIQFGFPRQRVFLNMRPNARCA